MTMQVAFRRYLAPSAAFRHYLARPDLGRAVVGGRRSPVAPFSAANNHSPHHGGVPKGNPP